MNRGSNLLPAPLQGIPVVCMFGSCVNSGDEGNVCTTTRLPRESCFAVSVGPHWLT